MSALACLRALGREAPTRQTALALLLGLCDLWTLARIKSDLVLEVHAEMPLSSTLFFHRRPMRDLPWLLSPLVDFIRLLTLGSRDLKQMERMFLAQGEAERRHLGHILRLASLALPAGLCLWLAVLAAMAGAGILGLNALAWWGVSLAGAGLAAGLWLIRLRAIADRRLGVLNALAEGCLSYLDGYAPLVCAENARFILPPSLRPSFFELEAAWDDDAYHRRYGDYDGVVLPESAPREEMDARLAQCLRDILAYDPQWLEKALPALSRDIAAELAPDRTDAVGAFARLAESDDDTLQTVMRLCPEDLLFTALLGAPLAVLERFFANTPEYGQKALLAGMRALGHLPATKIAEAQARMLDQIRDWTESGRLAAEKAAEDDLLALWKRMNGQADDAPPKDGAPP
jgi:hypothetical protein